MQKVDGNSNDHRQPDSCGMQRAIDAADFFFNSILSTASSAT